MKRRTILRLILCVAILAGMPRQGLAGETETASIRFGLTAVVVRENLRFLDRWADYLSEEMGRPVEFVRRRSYREVMDLLESGGLDFAWICGFPFVQTRDPEFLELLTVPVYQGEPRYHSYVIVHKDSPFQSLAELEGRVFAFSDPESNSGFLYPQAILAEKGRRPESFFRQTFFTYSHAETVEAVAAQVADGGAVDSYIWDYLSAYRPDLAKETRVIKVSPAFGFPPLVSRRGLDAKTVARMKQVFLGMADDPRGQAFLDGLMLDRFGDYPPGLFDNIRRMADRTRKSLLWNATGTGG